MPHYHIVEATEAVKPVLGDYFVEPEKSGPIPFHLLKRFFKGTEVSACPAGDASFNLAHELFFRSRESLGKDRSVIILEGKSLFIYEAVSTRHDIC